MEIWLATMPDCFGYGLIILADSRAEADKLLREAYKKMARSYESDRSYSEALDYFGGCIEKVEIGKVYNDGFNY